MKYYLVGIKGTGMSALAGLLHDDGHLVGGMDVDKDIFTEKELLKKEIYIDSLSFRNFMWVDLFIIGHQFMGSEVHQYIKDHQLPWIEYHKFIESYAKNKISIAVSGTHGKTTTVGMLYQALSSFHPTSMLRGDGVGKGGKNCNYFVFEACEYEKHFLVYHPDSLIITNIDYDHVDTYPTKEDYDRTFRQYVLQAKELFINIDDVNKVEHPKIVTFGLKKEADYACLDAKQTEKGMRGTLLYKEKSLPFFLPFYGEHNLMHALAVFAYLDTHHYDLEKGLGALTKFTSVNRRLECTIINDDVFIDDYAHHPKEIEATLQAVRAMYPSHKVIIFFKPDRYTRLLAFQEEFKVALDKADQSYVLPLYEHVEGYHDSRILCENNASTYLADENDLQNLHFPSFPLVFVYLSSKKMKDWIQKIVKNRESKS